MVSCVSARELHAEHNRVELGVREGAAPVVVRVQQQAEEMHMAGMAYRLTATLSADALGEGVVARQDSHDAGSHDDTHPHFATIAAR